ncbi:unnamed protein product [Zymoseptoria tritici ST99CH_3D1]|nr:unnamed protein product [Zymoseptoria tritici ST99CH_3D1]
MPDPSATTWAEEEAKHSWFKRTIQLPAQQKYQRYFVELVLRQKPLPPSIDGRHVPLYPASDKALIDERRGHAFISNSIRSSRYTVYDFVPKQLFFQVTRLSNFYFLCIGVPQTIPGLSTTGNYTTILPLAFFIILTVIKEGYDDFCRHRMDVVENNTLATVLRTKNDAGFVLTRDGILQSLRSAIPRRSLPWQSKSKEHEKVEEHELDEDDSFAWSRTKWQNIRVGDVLKLKRDDPIPADIILLNSTGENGVAYIETMALDGETNLKPKQALPILSNVCGTVSEIKRADVEFVLEDPNPNLYDFNGKVTVQGKTLPLTMNEVVYRGSVLRNTTHAYGLVINTGEECKIRMNANHHPTAKIPRLEKYANQVVLSLIVYVVSLAVGCAGGYLLWHERYEKEAWYLKDAAPEFKQIIVGFLIMYNNIIPLALYISLEIVKIGQMLMVHGDVKMYCAESNTPMTCNTNTILENLGQISYVLSDKTGTLTENVMRFRGISLGGIVWMHGNDSPLPTQSLPLDRAPDVRDIMVPAKGGKSSAGPTPAIVIEEREITSSGPSSSESSSEIRHSSAYRRSESRSRPQAERTTHELLYLIHHQPTSALALQAKEFLLSLAICHTALPEIKPNGKTDFQASSPDELALVRAAQDLGYLLTNRSSQTISLRVRGADGREVEEAYEILEVIEFTSKRKRMSIVVRCPDGRVWLVCKGADSAVIPRLRQKGMAERAEGEVRRSVDTARDAARRSEQNERISFTGGRPSLNLMRGRGGNSLDIRSASLDARRSKSLRRSLHLHRPTLEIPSTSRRPSPSTDIRRSLQQDLHTFESVSDEVMFTRCFEHIDAFASEGLRTLLFAHKYLEEGEYLAWKKVYAEATTSLVGREAKVEAVGEMIEGELGLLGASAIEDKLQRGVPETVERLRRANIRIWMLTGDKRETAINIAHSARICQPTSHISILDSTKPDLYTQLRSIPLDPTLHRVVVIDGQTLSAITEDPEMKHHFFTTTIPTTESVIVCRASPAQKAFIVTAIRARLPGLTLAIGDGANDIAMIQAAHVGIGLSGKEGLQAARVADFSIAQFRFLQRLLLVHGRYQYLRTAKFILMTFWKEVFFYMGQLMYSRYAGYTGSSLYEAWSLTVLNTLFTSLAVIVPGIFEQDLKPTTLLAVPELYSFGQLNRGLNLPMCSMWMIHGVAQGVIVWIVSWAFWGVLPFMSDRGTYALGHLVFSLGIMWTNYKCLILETRYKTLIVGISFAITTGGWWAWSGFLSGIYNNNLSPFDVKGGFQHGFGADWNWWATLVLAFSVLAVAEAGWAAACKTLATWGVVVRLPGAGGKGEGEDVGSVQLWQEMEKDRVVGERLREMAGSEGEVDCERGGKGGFEEDEEDEDVEIGRGRRRWRARWRWGRGEVVLN